MHMAMLATFAQPEVPCLDELVLVVLIQVGVQAMQPAQRLLADSAFPLPPLQFDALRLLQRVSANPY